CPHQRCGDLRGRRLHALSRTARTGAAGELAPRPGARRDRWPQCRRWRFRLQGCTLVLVRATRHVYPRGGLAGRASERARAPTAPAAVPMFELDGPRLAHALGINAQRDMAMARRLIERGVPVDASELADAAKPLAAMLKAKV